MTSTRPFQFSEVIVHSIASLCQCAVLTKRRLRSAVTRPVRSRKRVSRTTVALRMSSSWRYESSSTLSRLIASSPSIRSLRTTTGRSRPLTMHTVHRLASADTASRMRSEMTASWGRSTIGVSVPS